MHVQALTIPPSRLRRIATTNTPVHTATKHSREKSTRRSAPELAKDVNLVDLSPDPMNPLTLKSSSAQAISECTSQSSTPTNPPRTSGSLQNRLYPWWERPKLVSRHVRAHDDNLPVRDKCAVILPQALEKSRRAISLAHSHPQLCTQVVSRINFSVVRQT